MQIRILGPLEVHGDADVVILGGPKQRTVLAVLALHHGEVVSTDVLIEAVWGDRLPADPANALQYQIAQLRKVLEHDASNPEYLVTRSQGYVLESGTTSLDAHEFENSMGEARTAFEDGDYPHATTLIEGALGLWRGPALGEFRYEAFATADAARLDALELQAEELRVDIALADGRHAEMLPTLDQLTIAHPTRERLWARRMTALYRDGRQTDALRVYQQARGALADVGIEPTADLRDLEQQILNQDPTLTPTTAHATPTPSNLPTPPNRLIGRIDAVEAICDRLASNRLVTLVGPGGAGKTRLAIEAAGSVSSGYPDGVWFVRLDQLDGPELMASLVGQTIGLREHAELDVLDNLTAGLGERNTLIVLDNCEHLSDAVASLTDVLLARCRSTTVLATSQVTLGVQGESVFEVRPLTLPGQSDSIYDRLDDVAAIELFLERATSAGGPTAGWRDTELVAISNIVTALDGVPLAVELAAARTRSMSLNEIAQGLADPTTLLSKGARTAPSRQRSLTGVVEWSLRLLDPDQRDALAKLAVFVGGFDTDSAACVTGATVSETRELLGSLVDRSLLQRIDDVGSAARYRMLETLRQYAMDLLTHPELDAARNAHLDTFQRFASDAAVGITRREQLEWLMRLDAEYENVRAALAWSLDGGSIESGIQIGRDVGRWWDWTGRLKEASEWLGRLSDEAPQPSSGLGMVRAWQAYLAWEFGNVEKASELADRARETAEAVGDPDEHAAALSTMALVARSRGDLSDARALSESIREISDATGEAWMAAWAESVLATIDLEDTDFEGATRHAQIAIDRFEALGDLRGVGWGLVASAHAALRSSDLERAERLARKALDASTTTSDQRTIPWVLELLAAIAIDRGDHAHAAELWGAAHPFVQERGLAASLSEGAHLDNVESALRDHFGEAFTELVAVGCSDAGTVVRRELAMSDTIPHTRA